MKTVFLLAGFDLHETAAGEYFEQLRKGLYRKGYKVVPVDLSWYRKTPSQYAQGFIKFYTEHKGSHNTVIGNSFGAVIAFISAPELQPDVLYLSSLSPYFKEDRQKRPDNYGVSYFGIRRLNDLRPYSADRIAKQLSQLKTQVYVIYGEKEHKSAPLLVARCKDTARKITQAHLIEIAKAPHDLSDSTYSAGLIKLL